MSTTSAWACGTSELTPCTCLRMLSTDRFCESRMREILTSGSTRGEDVVPSHRLLSYSTFRKKVFPIHNSLFQVGLEASSRTRTASSTENSNSCSPSRTPRLGVLARRVVPSAQVISSKSVAPPKIWWRMVAVKRTLLSEPGCASLPGRDKAASANPPGLLDPRPSRRSQMLSGRREKTAGPSTTPRHRQANNPHRAQPCSTRPRNRFVSPMNCAV